ncbi:MAG: diaminopropionate ammonia-lyase [Ignavibacteriales bacterium]|nr:MAG: diaminopropionate ammonia-lyase [Ignavibacteriales bacterium]
MDKSFNQNNLNQLVNVINNKNVNPNVSEYANLFSDEIAIGIRNFHRTVPKYNTTPLIELEDTAIKFGISKLWLKDESHRMGLKAFKILGGSYAITNILSNKLGINKEFLSFEKLSAEDLSSFSFVTATDGNHGRGVAWVANKLGCKSFVFMPNTSSESRINNIKEFATEVFVVDGNYDFATEKAKQFAKNENSILVQDSSWFGYEEIPLMIMQGYLTLIDEIYEQLNGENFTHIFLHCGVGSMPAAIEAFLVNKFGVNKPKTIIVEPNKADCFYKSIEINDGEPHIVSGKLDSIMAGLSCGIPSKIAWDIISKHSDYFTSCVDEITKIGMRELAKLNIVSGESGAVSYGILSHAFKNDKSILESLEINADSKIMLISTEGDTDPEFYNSIINVNSPTPINRGWAFLIAPILF